MNLWPRRALQANGTVELTEYVFDPWWAQAVSAVSSRYRAVREDLMRFKPKNTAALHIALGGLPDKMRVEVDPDIRVSARTVGELRRVKTWPENLAITTPQERHPESAVRVNKANVATRVSPKT